MKTITLKVEVPEDVDERRLLKVLKSWLASIKLRETFTDEELERTTRITKERVWKRHLEMMKGDRRP